MNATTNVGRVLRYVLMMLLPAAIACAQPADQTNAATWYRRALERLRSLSEEQQQLLWNYDPHEGAPSPELRSLVSELAPVMELARRGAKQEFSDFELDRSEGIGMLMPHLGEMRSLAHLVNMNAQLRLQAGDSAGAAESLAIMYRMSDHLADDRVIISSLVAQAVFRLGDRTVQEAMDAGKLNAGDAMTLLKAASRLSPSDPFDMVEGVIAEHEIMLTTVESMLEAKANGDPDPIPPGLQNEIPPAAMLMTEDSLRVDVGELDLVMERVVEAFATEDRERGKFELQQIEKELEKGEHGMFAQLLLPALVKLHDRMVESELLVEKRVKSLQELASGEVTPGEAANAALWYLRGIELLEQMPVEKREQYRAVAANPAPLAPQVIHDLQQANQPISLFVEGATMKRCDFSFAREMTTTRVKRPYIDGMRDAVRLLHADAVRMAQASDYDGAARRLATCFSMSRHVGDDGALLSAIVAHDIFTSTAKLYADVLAPHATAKHKEMLLDAVKRTSRKDPFGYISGMVRDRELAYALLRIAGAHEEAKDEAATLPSPKLVVEKWDVDHLLSMLLFLDALRTRGGEDQPPDPMFDFTMVSEVVSLDAVSRILIAAQSLASRQPTPATPESEEAKVASIYELELPPVAPVRKRMTEARQAVRDMWRTLRDDDAEAPPAETPAASETPTPADE